ncbi:hypothetical protein BGZ61DRAFT_482973 [Ilyonectria robusta]|uniref:uncharacterized protein n=1 Tax=Ilyonectria robusta TaxID=1079257 RepID=UPI001E8D1D4A|nr:uncharacterized protein BGZ61DRAFT_482973 [Ilyonectria robusta]KAH8670624.1 hypothetical protein BGZ61DRAFT_482973 [Ilyonectria robusta]
MLNAILSLLLSWLCHLLLIAARHREGFRRTAGGAGSSFGSLPPAQPNHDIPAARRRHQFLHSCVSVSQVYVVLLSPVDSRSLSNSPLIRLSVRSPPLVRRASRPAVFFYSFFSPTADLPLPQQTVCRGRPDIQGQSDIYNIHLPQNRCQIPSPSGGIQSPPSFHSRMDTVPTASLSVWDHVWD